MFVSLSLFFTIPGAKIRNPELEDQVFCPPLPFFTLFCFIHFDFLNKLFKLKNKKKRNMASAVESPMMEPAIERNDSTGKDAHKEV